MEIVLLTTHPTSACAFYRSVGVLQQLRKLDPSINFKMSDSSNWASIGNADLVFLERPQDERFVKAIQDCKALGIPVWSDFDDDLFNLEKSNPGYSFYSQKKTQLAMAYSIANSDIVTVSTQLIADSFIQRFHEKLNLEVVPNALNDYFFPLVQKENQENRISWRGSKTHRADLLKYKREMWDFAKEHPTIEWNFFGEDLWYVTEGIKNSFSYSEDDLIKYMYKFNSIKPSVHLVPLVDNHFNRCKSNIAWIEATWVGAACVLPNFPEFEKGKNHTYSSGLTFKSILNELILNKSRRQEVYLSSFEYIKKYLLLSRLNKVRLEIAKNFRRK